MHLGFEHHGGLSVDKLVLVQVALSKLVHIHRLVLSAQSKVSLAVGHELGLAIYMEVGRDIDLRLPELLLPLRLQLTHAHHSLI